MDEDSWLQFDEEGCMFPTANVIPRRTNRSSIAMLNGIAEIIRKLLLDGLDKC